MFLTISLIIFACKIQVFALNNGLALTPPMGWMTWQRFRCIVDCATYPDDCISEKLIKDMADMMVVEGYSDAGYEYVIVDDCWMARERDEDGKLQADPIRFPNGIKYLANYVHDLGLKFGIYEAYGIKTCAGFPGILDTSELDAETFASWDVDYVKLDACNTDVKTITDGYIEFGKYLNATGRPMVYSCSWPTYQELNGIRADYRLVAKKCNLWRNWDDVFDTWTSVNKIINWYKDNQNRFKKQSGPGHWNDPDMLVIGNFGLSLDQSQSQMAIWSILAAPLIMSVDLRTIKPEFKEILLNEVAIEINQDPLGEMGTMVYEPMRQINVWTKRVTPIVDEKYSLAVCILNNRLDGHPKQVVVPLAKIGLSKGDDYNVINVFRPSHADLIRDDKLVVKVNPSGVVYVKFALKM